MSDVSFLTDSPGRSTLIDSEDSEDHVEWVDVPTQFLVGLKRSPNSLGGRVKSVTISKTTMKVALLASAVITGAFVVSSIAFLQAGLFLAAGVALALLAINHLSFMKLGTSF